MRTQPTQARSKETVKALVEAANLEFGEHGFHAAHMTAIAQRAGASIGALYRFFPDKDALGSALCDAYLEEVSQSYLPLANELRDFDDLPRVVARLIESAAELQRRFPGYYRLTNDVSPVDQQWICDGVRDVLVAEFTNIVGRLGFRPAANVDSLHEPLGFAVDVVRGRLATLPLDGEREALIRELTVMVTAYVQQRLQPPR